MLITIDTNNITDADRAVLALVLEGYDGTMAGNVHNATKDAETPATAEQLAQIQALKDELTTAAPAPAPGGQDKPKRTRRTKAQMEADAKAAEEAKAATAAFSPDDTADNAGKPETKEESERVGENAESDAAEETPAAELESDGAASISMEELKGLATKLITADRSAMVELLEQFNARRLSEIPEGDWGKFAAEIRAKLSA